jgi:hypothetical protein
MGIEDRTRRERETLVFHSPEGATDFARTVENRIKKEDKPGVSQAREVVSQELAKQFEQEGHGVSLLTHPWEHSNEEHIEAQQLVDLAFAKDLSAAISEAEKSSSFPRNMDLFHDVLTGEMYEAIQKSRVHTQPVPHWIIWLLVLFFALLLSVILVFVYTL